MSFLLIPNEITNQEVVVWIGVIKEKLDPNTLSIRYNDAAILLDQNWTTYTTQSKRNSLAYQYLKIQNLQPETKYVFELYSGDKVLLASCSLNTLPSVLPTVDKNAFTVLLGSCFCSSRPGSDALGMAYAKLREKEKIDLKILCGDQVYLDDPAWHFLFNKHSFEDLEEILLSNYVKT